LAKQGPVLLYCFVQELFAGAETHAEVAVGADADVHDASALRPRFSAAASSDLFSEEALAVPPAEKDSFLSADFLYSVLSAYNSIVTNEDNGLSL
jgi:hypothetical protein